MPQEAREAGGLFSPLLPEDNVNMLPREKSLERESDHDSRKCGGRRDNGQPSQRPGDHREGRPTHRTAR